MKIMVGTPAYGGHVTCNYMNAFVKAKDAMPDYIELVLNTYGGDSLITRGRNTMVAQFMASDCDALLFIDADIGFDPWHITRVVGAGKDIVGEIYPIKEFNWPRVVEIAHQKPDAKGFDDIAGEAGFFNLVTNGIGMPNQLGYAPVMELGTGFMFIRRNVFEKLREKNPKANYTTDRRGGENFEVDNFFDAFVVEYDAPMLKKDGSPFIKKDGGLIKGKTIKKRRYLSEDYAFCALWREAGGEIWVDVGTTMLSHHGAFTFGQA